MADAKGTVCKMQSVNLKLLKNCIAKKKESIEKLQSEYNSLKMNENLKSKNMKSSHLMLKAEIEVLSSSVPISVPNFEPLLFAYVHYSLRKEVNNLEELISFQNHILCISLKKSKKLKKLCEREKLDFESTDNSVYQKMSKEKERIRSEILECLHRKLACNIRRITIQFYPSMHTEEEKIKNSTYLFTKEKSMLHILENLLAELSPDSEKSNELEKSSCIRIDKSFPKKYIKLLLDNQIVEHFKEDPFCLKLVLR